ncbi:unnamed protein product [Lasius platythorax]|uniref:Uncharacterized protein n=1 Tax=Lasius platythorax TaxID=488582 RepID=A0AAV2NUA8_9HYME
MANTYIRSSISDAEGRKRAFVVLYEVKRDVKVTNPRERWTRAVRVARFPVSRARTGSGSGGGGGDGEPHSWSPPCEPATRDGDRVAEKRSPLPRCATGIRVRRPPPLLV